MYFEDSDIQNLRNVYNKEHSSNPIPAGSAKEIWSALQTRMHDECKSGMAECIIASMMSKPVAPKTWNVNPEEWLSSLDIEAIEKQFTKLFSNYYYVGTVPIDFDKRSETGKCLVNSLCAIHISDIYKKGKTQIGIVFNTDVSTGPGQHWIALFCDMREDLEFPRITFFDSYGQKPEKEVQILMQRWKDQWDATGIHKKPTELSYNKTRHQYEDSECGMYCLYFHYCCLTGVSMEKRIPDEVVRSFRSMLFRVGKK